MMRRPCAVVATGLTLGLIAAGASPAAAEDRRGAAEAGGGTTFVARSGRPMPARWQGWARRSLVPIVTGRITVSLDGCPSDRTSAGCVFYNRQSHVYLNRRRASLPATLYHELGHFYDFRVLNNSDRRRFKRLVGRPRDRWSGGGRLPAEQFAEAYSFCARYRRIKSIRAFTTYGYDPSPKQHRAACRLIVDAAKPSTPPPQPPPNPPPVTTDPAPPPQPPDDPATEPDDPPLVPPIPPLPPPSLIY